MTLTVEQKYALYESSVQDPKSDISFINQVFKTFGLKKPLRLREDFSGTALISHMWVKQSPRHTAVGIDLDKEPISYGLKKHGSKLTADQKKRIELRRANVLDNFSFKVDALVAFNFSYFIFKTNEAMLKYFKQAYKGLDKEGIFFLDLFGGTDAVVESEEVREYKKFNYYWDCEKYNVITNECFYSIHYKVGRTKHKRVFTYDWRMWTPRELVDLLKRAGFARVDVFWEGDGDDGSGDGVYSPTKDARNCPGWVAYIVAIKG